MPTPKLNSLAQLVSGPGLARLGDEARRLARLREQVRRTLPPELAPWCLGAEIHGRSLVLYMASAATATALRYRQQALLASLADELDPPCTRLTVRVMPDPPLPPAPRPAPRMLPEAIRRLLEQTAAGVGDTALARSLRRLAGSKSTPHK